MLIVTLLEALELGLIYSILALGVFLSFRTLNTPDLTVDGSIVTGAAISAVMCTAAAEMSPAVQGLVCVAGLLLAFVFGLGIYSINLRIQGKANVNLTSTPTIYDMAEEKLGGFQWSSIILGIIIAVIIILLIYGFLKTRKGFALRATGDNEEMVRAAGISSDNMKLLGLSVSNGLVGLAGGLLAQYQGYSDVGMGTGMVVIGLASVIIGEVLFGTKSLMRRLVAVALGAIVYRMVIGVALYLGMPPTDLKLVSAVIVTIALAMGMMGESFSFRSFRKKTAKGDGGK